MEQIAFATNGTTVMTTTKDYDTLNRLTNITTLDAGTATWTATTAVGPQQMIRFEFDCQSRRVEKLVSTNNGSGYVPQSTNRFVYDGWNLIAVLKSDLSLLTSAMWGLDLSGTLQGAGGVGGLLFIGDFASAIGYHAVAYDGNGNVTMLLKADGSGLTAHYEYGPFGEPLRATGPMAKANPFRFSTKYQDDESDLLYYGYRSYNPSLGRWLSRDPVDEPGFCALHPARTSCGASVTSGHYCFIENDPVAKCDSLGLETWINVCFISCKCRWNIHAVWSATPRPAELAKVKLCCEAVGKIFCSSMQSTADRIAAQFYFQGCVASWAGL